MPARRSDSSQPSRAAIPPPSDRPVTKTRASSMHAALSSWSSERVERLDVVRRVGHLAAHVPEGVRPRGRGVGDEEMLAIGQTAETGVAGHVLPGLARAVEGEHKGARLVRAPGDVQTHAPDAGGRVEGQHVVARRQRGAGLVGRVRGVVHRGGARPPCHARDREDAGEDDGDGPHAAGVHARTVPAKTHRRQTTKVTRVTAGRMATSPARRGRCSCPTANVAPIALSPAPSSATTT